MDPPAAWAHLAQRSRLCREDNGRRDVGLTSGGHTAAAKNVVKECMHACKDVRVAELCGSTDPSPIRPRTLSSLWFKSSQQEILQTHPEFSSVDVPLIVVVGRTYECDSTLHLATNNASASAACHQLPGSPKGPLFLVVKLQTGPRMPYRRLGWTPLEIVSTPF
jgi:hypothetical protein